MYKLIQDANYRRNHGGGDVDKEHTGTLCSVQIFCKPGTSITE